MSLPPSASSPPTDRRGRAKGAGRWSARVGPRCWRGVAAPCSACSPSCRRRDSGSAAAAPSRVEALKSVGGIPPFLAGEFEEASGFARRPDGSSLVFDRRRHRVYAIDAARTAVTPLVEIGYEVGRVLRPTAFDVAAHRRLHRRRRARPATAACRCSQSRGQVLNTFPVAASESPRVIADDLVLNGIAAARYTGTTVLLEPARARRAGHRVQRDRARCSASSACCGAPGSSRDPDVHLAFNSRAAAAGARWRRLRRVPRRPAGVPQVLGRRRPRVRAGDPGPRHRPARAADADHLAAPAASTM